MKKEKINVALVGLGGHGATIRKSVKMCAKLNIVACHDINKELVDEVKAEFNCDGFLNYDELLENPILDAVIISTPNFLHFEQTCKALQSGKDVFVEKPITAKVEEAEKIVKLAQEKNLIVQVGHNTRKRKVFRKAKEIIERGLLGKIIFVESNISMSTGLTEFPQWKKDKDKCPLLPMTQLGIHFVDTLIYLFGDIEEVSSFARNAYLDVEDSAVALFRFSNDIIGTLSSSYVAQNAYEMKIYGTEGVLKCYLNKIELQKTTEINPSVYFFDEDIESYIEELCEFAECIINRRKPEVDAEIGLKNLKVIEAMIESNITKKVVKI